MSAARFGWHSWVVDQLVAYFRERNLPTMREVGVKVAPRDVPNPDVMVLSRPLTPADLDRSQFTATDVVRVVEVVSEESRDRDTLTKPAKYGAARIPEYWLVERHPTEQVDASISVFKLTPAGSYEISTRYHLSQLRPLQL
jgi:Uma2 family endonuclease